MNAHQKSDLRLCVAVGLLALVSSAACENKQAPAKTADAGADAAKTSAATTEPLQAPRVPAKPQKHSPSFATVLPDEHYDVDMHTETKLCGNCHTEIATEWADSVHALASMANPFYKVSFDDFVKDSGRDKSPHCAGCHDPALLFDGSIVRATPLKERRAYVGVTCNSCHGIRQATTDGNGSYTLSTSPIPIPKEGDDHSLAKHKSLAATPVLRTAQLCASCHLGFFSPESGHGVVIPGLGEHTEWRRSGYAGNSSTRIDSGVPEKNCVGCHMPEVAGEKPYKSHRFAGGHSALAAAIDSPEQLEAVRKMVESAAIIDIAAWGVGDVQLGEPLQSLKKDDDLWVDVVVYNQGTGHRFPGGALDLKDTWVEFELTDAAGKVLAAAGDQHEKTAEDPTAVVLHAVMSSTDGQMVKMHRVHSFRTPVVNHSITARDALVARYEWKAPRDLAGPLKMTARLKHRRLQKQLHDRACEVSKTEEGKLVAEQTKRFIDKKVDPCVAQPVIEMSTATAEIGGTAHSPDRPQWRRLWERGIGLMHNVQENLPEAIESLEAAKKALPTGADKIDVARVTFSLGLAAARQGRTQDAMDHFAAAEKLVGEHPAIHFARGSAHQRTFHNEEAVEWFTKASKLANDDRIWRQLAIAAGSVSRPRVAYDAARAGLILEPRDPHLLRSQMLALRKLPDANKDWVEIATKAFQDFKRDEEAATIRDKCSDQSEICRRERLPLHVVKLRGR